MCTHVESMGTHRHRVTPPAPTLHTYAEMGTSPSQLEIPPASPASSEGSYLTEAVLRLRMEAVMAG
jgi:hypothetical protein